MDYQKVINACLLTGLAMSAVCNYLLWQEIHAVAKTCDENFELQNKQMEKLATCTKANALHNGAMSASVEKLFNMSNDLWNTLRGDTDGDPE